MAASISVSAQAPPLELSDLLRQAASYVRRFEQEFASMIGEERYDQRLRTQRAPITDYTRAVEQRRLISDILFMWMPEEESWLTARNVRSVDGRPVQDSAERLDRLLADQDLDPVARVRRLRDEGARFNIGVIQRNFSDPTLVLQFLDPAFQSRFRFALDGTERIEGIRARRLTFREDVGPTLIQTEGRDSPASGEIWLNPQDGAVIRTRARLQDDAARLSAELDVRYRRDTKLDLWVPSEMAETYEQQRRVVTPIGTGAGWMYDRIDCTARYGNFRRFETSARLIVDP